MYLPDSGIVTLRNWLMAPDGERYLHVFSKHWRIITDKEMPIDNFHSRERWSLICRGFKNNILVLIPGCEVCGFITTDNCPEHTEPYPHKADEPDMPPGVFNLDTGKGYK